MYIVQYFASSQWLVFLEILLCPSRIKYFYTVFWNRSAINTDYFLFWVYFFSKHYNSHNISIFVTLLFEIELI